MIKQKTMLQLLDKKNKHYQVGQYLTKVFVSMTKTFSKLDPRFFNALNVLLSILYRA
jgi:hypothetical protein